MPAEDKQKAHFVAMAGLHGYMPATCEVFPDVDSAVDYLASMHELGRRRRAELKRDLYLELRNDGDSFPFVNDGNEYCEITECDCDDPSVHSESGEYGE